MFSDWIYQMICYHGIEKWLSNFHVVALQHQIIEFDILPNFSGVRIGKNGSQLFHKINSTQMFRRHRDIISNPFLLTQRDAHKLITHHIQPRRFGIKTEFSTVGKLFNKFSYLTLIFNSNILMINLFYGFIDRFWCIFNLCRSSCNSWFIKKRSLRKKITLCWFWCIKEKVVNTC